MAVDPRKLRQLVLVEKAVHRGGRQHIQKYWVRAGEDPAAERELKRPPGMSDHDWEIEQQRRRDRNEYVRKWREGRKQQGLLKKPGDPPPPLPKPIPPGPPPEKKESEGDDKAAKRREYVRKWREKQKLLKQQAKEKGEPPPPEKKLPPPPEPPRKPGELKDQTRNIVKAPATKWFGLNSGVLRAAGNDLVEQFKTTPPGVKPGGVTAVISGGLGRGVAGQYAKGPWLQGQISLKPDVARALGVQIRAGGEATFAGNEAFRILTHEMFHAVSHPDYEYESRHLSSRPHAAMQEATTEILGQLHKGKVMAAFGVQENAWDARPLFTTSGIHNEVTLNRSPSYSTYVRQFGRVVAAIHGTGEDERELDQHVERWAREIKGTRGNMRYQRMSDALVEKRMPRDHPAFMVARERVVEDLKYQMQSNTGTEDIKNNVIRVVNAELFEHAVLSKQRL